MEKIKEKINGQTIEIDHNINWAFTEIKKPFPQRDGLYFSLNEKLIKKLVNDRIENLSVNIGKNNYNFKPDWILKHGKLIEKVYLYPDNPLRLYEVNLTKYLKR